VGWDVKNISFHGCDAIGTNTWRIIVSFPDSKDEERQRDRLSCPLKERREEREWEGG
jgi:hypothetical protein